MRWLMLLFAVCGCSTAFHSSVPVRTGVELVVGSAQGRPAAWLCPTEGLGSHDCRRVEVEE